VTKKVTLAVARIARGEQSVLTLDNLSAERDWGYAPEYVEATWRMLQQDKPGDYVIGTGISYSVRSFVEFCFDIVGVEIVWSGSGSAKVGRDARSGDARIMVDPVYYRPLEVERLRSGSAKAAELGWKATFLAPER
jgi:GDPmannose 4,6-dehydratase